MANPYAPLWKAVLDAQTESEFFIRISTFLKAWHIDGFKCSSEFEISQSLALPCPYFKFTYFMLVGQPYMGGISWFRQPVWVFTLQADGTLIWDAMHFEGAIAYDQYQTFTQSRTTGLEAIKRMLREQNGSPFLLSKDTVTST